MLASLLLPNSSLRLDDIEIPDCGVTAVVTSTRTTVECPVCSHLDGESTVIMYVLWRTYLCQASVFASSFVSGTFSVLIQAVSQIFGEPLSDWLPNQPAGLSVWRTSKP